MIKKSIIGVLIFFGFVFFTTPSNALLLYSGEGPRIYGRLHETGAHSVRVRWSTGDPSITWIKYGETVYLDQEVKEEGVVKKNHEIFLKGLRANTTYYYMIRARNDSDGKESWFEGRSFKTLAEGKSEIDPSAPVLPTISFEDQIQKGVSVYYVSKKETKSFDTSAPVIKSLEVRSLEQGNAAEIKWTTDTISSSVIEYGGSWDYGFETESICKGNCTTHSAVLKGLAGGRKTFFRIYTSSGESLDETNSGRAESRTAHLSFTQRSTDGIVEVAPKDYSSPLIRSVDVVVKESKEPGFIPVDINVSNDELSRVSVELSPEHDQMVTMQSQELRHQSTIQFPRLTPGIYHFQVVARDSDINKTSSRHFTFMLPGIQKNTSSTVVSSSNSVSAPLVLEKKSTSKVVQKKNVPKKILKKKNNSKKVLKKLSVKKSHKKVIKKSPKKKANTAKKK